jgi:digalactosyldiacylglycerol synthase
MVRAYCHKVIKLSLILQSFAPEKEATSNVHGVRSDFINTGIQRAEQLLLSRQNRSEIDSQNNNMGDDLNGTQVYFIGKLLWAKGLDIMLELEDYYKQVTGQYFSIDIYGSGPDSKAITRAFHGFRMYQKKLGDKNATQGGTDDVREPERSSSSFNIAIMGTTLSVETFVDDNNNDDIDALPNLESLQVMAKEKIAKIKETINSVEIPKSFAEFRRQPIPAAFPGRVDHATLKDYKVFVNPSISEVLCTTTAEALAMGKFAIIPDHPSNKFFLQFPNCLAYRNKFEFVANLRWALTHDPEPLTPNLARIFSWEAATDRLIDASAVTYRDLLARELVGTEKLDERIAWLHNELGKGTKGDLLRMLFGAGPVSKQVKYQKLKQAASETVDEGKEDALDDGLRGKFYRSSFAKALRAALEDVSLMMQ